MKKYIVERLMFFKQSRINAVERRVAVATAQLQYEKESMRVSGRYFPGAISMLVHDLVEAKYDLAKLTNGKSEFLQELKDFSVFGVK